MLEWVAIPPPENLPDPGCQARLDPGEVMPLVLAALHLSTLSFQCWLDSQATICLVAPYPRSTFLATVMLSSIWTLVLITLKH